VLRATDGVLTHANHCVAPDLFAHDTNARDYPETLTRGERAKSLANARMIDESYLHSMLADHETSPGSICLHIEPCIPLVENYESIASIIFDLTTGTMDIAEGPPCENAYHRHSLDEYLRVTSYRQTGC
jgi:isopenicillin-N N-acyltransferase like protein